jgi:hypothetical protein
MPNLSEAPMTLTVDKAKEFFGALYDERTAPDLNEIDSAAIRMVARLGPHVMPGNDALGLVMMNHVMATPKVSKDARIEITAAVLGDIKAMAVASFLNQFPQTNVEQLVASARKAGYDVEILSVEKAAALPRSVVHRT